MLRQEGLLAPLLPLGVDSLSSDHIFILYVFKEANNSLLLFFSNE